LRRGNLFLSKSIENYLFGEIMEAVAAVGSKPAVKVGANQSFVVGRIEHTSTFEVKGKRVHEAVVVTPAADLYTLPGKVAVQSSYKLGAIGDDVQVLVAVTGIPNSWSDRATGEVRHSANVRLVAVE
jgi:hypothetical protein